MDASGETITGGRLVTRELAEWVAGLTFDDLPQPAIDEAGRVLADYLGESLFVGATKPWGQSIAAFCASQGGGQPESTIIATGKKTLASRAALANGTMALGFEYADFNGFGRRLPVRGDRAPGTGRGASTLGQGVGPLHRHRLRGDRPADQGDDRTDTVPVLRACALRHLRGGRRRRPAARPEPSVHQLRPRTGGRLHRWNVPGPRGGRLAKVAQRRYGKRARGHGGRARRDRLSGDGTRVGGGAGFLQHVLQRPIGRRSVARRPW